MAKKDLVDKLNELVADGTKKSYIERECKLPANSLASVLTRKKTMPIKWVPKLEAFLKRPVIHLEEKRVETKIEYRDVAPTERDETIRFSESDKTAASIKAETALINKIKELEQSNVELTTKLRLMGDSNVKMEHQLGVLRTENAELRQKTAKGPSLADVVMGHINKPTEDRAANIRDIKGGKGKGGKNGEK